MLKPLNIVFLLSLLWAALSGQEHKLFWDGNDWQRIEKISAEYPEFTFWIKSAYLSGLFDSKLFYQLKTQVIAPALADSVFRDLVTPTSARRLIAGIDMLYRDPANLYLPLPNALITALMYQQGYPQTEIDAYIAKSKKWLNALQSGR